MCCAIIANLEKPLAYTHLNTIRESVKLAISALDKYQNEPPANCPVSFFTCMGTSIFGIFDSIYFFMLALF